MGCGSSTDNTATTVPTEHEDSAHGDAAREDSENHADRSSADLKDRLDELVARLIVEEELALLQFQYADVVQEAPKPPPSLTRAEVAAHSSVLTIETQKHPGDSWTSSVVGQECALCLEEFEVGDKLRVLFCHHTFHKHCIDEWFSRSRTCPFCLRDITSLLPPEKLETFPFRNSSSSLTSPPGKPLEVENEGPD
eukprot:TRINITY_DN1283_c0_g1_i1.p2 TRINITY_DN1283_c0_g1~~TRINITY_DN1283_c0_g1_i1.p2  ORF type:complete len:195 (+),score=47.99 TRINITY_DN1283_c0_g1_i1:178-762(+)